MGTMRTFAALLVLLTVLSAAAGATTYGLYSPSRFAAAQAQARPILVEVRAAWCASCELQASALAKLEKNPEFKNLIVFTINFDFNRDVVDRLKVAVPSTLILFKGKTEIARLTGQTDPKVIEAFLEGVSSHPRGVSLSFTNALLALLAGIVSILSPCVLPLLPIVLVAAATKHRFGPAALGIGFVTFFVVIGIFVDTIGLGIGVSSTAFRVTGAVIMIAFGLVLLSDGLQHRLESLAAPIQAAGNRVLVHLAPAGLPGQFLIGGLLGMVWSPCIGPTLGAAIALAVQGKSVGHATLTMFLFGVGTALPLVLIGSVSRRTLIRWRKRLDVAGHVGHVLLGLLLLAFGAMILSGFDRYLESTLVQVVPDWLTALVTRF
jgi:cytochrome c-type biogenesis protein